MGLEAGNVSVTHDRASRLHQAIILSSEQHATAGHCTTLGRRRQFISILSPEYFLFAPGREMRRKGAGEPIIC